MKAIMISIKPQWVERVKQNDKLVEYAICYYKSRLIGIYQNMKQRCNNPKSARYKRYGGRGIKICDEWLGENGKNKFIEWALDNGYEPDLSIERINIDKDYSPTNCKWIPLCDQSKNTQRTHLITHNGKTQCLEEWCKELGLKSNTIYYRSINNNISLEDAIFNYKPKHKNYKTHCINGHKFTEENTRFNSKGYRYCLTCKELKLPQYNKNRREKRRS